MSDRAFLVILFFWLLPVIGLGVAAIATWPHHSGMALGAFLFGFLFTPGRR